MRKRRDTDQSERLPKQGDVDRRRLVTLSMLAVALIVALAITSALASLLFPADHQLGVELRNATATCGLTRYPCSAP
jgi:hypothetical protein